MNTPHIRHFPIYVQYRTFKNIIADKPIIVNHSYMILDKFYI